MTARERATGAKKRCGTFGQWRPGQIETLGRCRWRSRRWCDGQDRWGRHRRWRTGRLATGDHAERLP